MLAVAQGKECTKKQQAPGWEHAASWGWKLHPWGNSISISSFLLGHPKGTPPVSSIKAIPYCRCKSHAGALCYLSPCTELIPLALNQSSPATPDPHLHGPAVDCSDRTKGRQASSFVGKREVREENGSLKHQKNLSLRTRFPDPWWEGEI